MPTTDGVLKLTRRVPREEGGKARKGVAVEMPRQNEEGESKALTVKKVIIFKRLTPAKNGKVSVIVLIGELILKSQRFSFSTR